MEQIAIEQTITPAMRYDVALMFWIIIIGAPLIMLFWSIVRKRMEKAQAARIDAVQYDEI